MRSTVKEQFEEKKTLVQRGSYLSSEGHDPHWTKLISKHVMPHKTFLVIVTCKCPLYLFNWSICLWVERTPIVNLFTTKKDTPNFYKLKLQKAHTHTHTHTYIHHMNTLTYVRNSIIHTNIPKHNHTLFVTALLNLKQIKYNYFWMYV